MDYLVYYNSYSSVIISYKTFNRRLVNENQKVLRENMKVATELMTVQRELRDELKKSKRGLE